jgi:hypothetical protein
MLLYGSKVNIDLYDWKSDNITAKLECEIPSYIWLLDLCFNSDATAAIVQALTRSICAHEFCKVKTPCFTDQEISVWVDQSNLPDGFFSPNKQAVASLATLSPKAFVDSVKRILIQQQNKEEDQTELIKELEGPDCTDETFDKISQLKLKGEKLLDALMDVCAKENEFSWRAAKELAGMDMSETATAKLLDIMSTAENEFLQIEIIQHLGAAKAKKAECIAVLKKVLLTEDLGHESQLGRSPAAALGLGRLYGPDIPEDLAEKSLGIVMKKLEETNTIRSINIHIQIASALKYCGTWPGVDDILLKMVEKKETAEELVDIWESGRVMLRTEAGKSINFIVESNVEQ